jgi:hypothetical protein
MIHFEIEYFRWRPDDEAQPVCYRWQYLPSIEDAKEFALANLREPGSLEAPDGFRIREAGMIRAEVIINPPQFRS